MISIWLNNFYYLSLLIQKASGTAKKGLRVNLEYR